MVRPDSAASRGSPGSSPRRTASTASGWTPSASASRVWKATAHSLVFATALESSSTCRSAGLNVPPPRKWPKAEKNELSSAGEFAITAAAPGTNPNVSRRTVSGAFASAGAVSRVCIG